MITRREMEMWKHIGLGIVFGILFTMAMCQLVDAQDFWWRPM